MASGPPLSWHEARCRLVRLLEEYLDASPPPTTKRNDNNRKETSQILQKILAWDLDIYIGTLGSPTALLVIGCLVFVNGGVGSSSEIADLKYRRSQLAASILVFLGGVLNLWLIRRRRYTTSQGSDSLKRREISRFLREVEKQEKECSPSDRERIDIWPNLAGTSLTDIYPVYRRKNIRNDIVAGGSWTRIPTLLLVSGDHIALQVGDITPAKCRVVGGPAASIEFDAGEQIALDKFGKKANSVTSKLPRGRTTLPKESQDLLILCNNMQIFELLESPLESFLRQPQVESRIPQSMRQLEIVRGATTILGTSLFATTLIVILARIDFSSPDLTLLLPGPFLVLLGALPFTAPACLIFIEALGTSRILAAYHPVASLRQEISSGGTTNIDLLLLRYFLATVSNRLSLQDFGRQVHRFWSALCTIGGGESISPRRFALVRIPPVSLNLLEKVGVATAFTLVDDELVCEPQAIPQQLLIPSAHGLKLLDIYPTYDDERDDGEDSESKVESKRTPRKSFDGEFHDSDSESDDGFEHHQHMPSRSHRRRLLRKVQLDRLRSTNSHFSHENTNSDEVNQEVQFEDPLWWQHLPSLKCIGLACLLVDQKDEQEANSQTKVHPQTASQAPTTGTVSGPEDTGCREALVRLICAERRSMQLRSLAQCIGFSTKESDAGPRGDVSTFAEKFRLHIISSARLHERLAIDSHERGSEESRWWGLLRPDSTSVIVKDTRTGGYQLVTVGDPRVVTRLCQEAWQGENSTILPLASHDRQTILETSKSWRLSDLDVEAFSYAPIPNSFENMCDGSKSKFYLLDNDPKADTFLPIQKDKAMTGEWPLLHNQIFLGILGSLIVPRQETQGLLSTLQEAGVRFVYFSPRNMRLTKEIATQMGIDVAWNCAISLRPLDQGEEDPHRMVSTYGDWDVNAKLPHGVEAVRWHLEEVDNVPLLVSLFTDVTKNTTMQMIETFQEYHDTVIAVGLSHLPWNSRIFSTADLAVGVDVLVDCLQGPRPEHNDYNSLLPSEILFVSAISAHQCAFKLRGVESIAYMPTILAHGRASLEAASSAGIFLICGGVSFSFYALFCSFSVAVVMPFVPTMSALILLQVVLPLLGLPITMSDPDNMSMFRVPPKNDPAQTFRRKEAKTFFTAALLKALPPAIFPQLLYLIALGEFLIHYDADLVASVCFPTPDAGSWHSVIRCNGLSGYAGVARDYASALALAELLVCIIIPSATFVNRTLPLTEEPPWRKNHIWVFAVVAALLIAIAYISSHLQKGSLAVLPWYFYVLALAMPFICLVWNEFVKRSEKTVVDRAEKLRRLQFETRLGMWSPK